MDYLLRTLLKPEPANWTGSRFDEKSSRWVESLQCEALSVNSLVMTCCLYLETENRPGVGFCTHLDALDLEITIFRVIWCCPAESFLRGRLRPNKKKTLKGPKEISSPERVKLRRLYWVTCSAASVSIGQKLSPKLIESCMFLLYICLWGIFVCVCVCVCVCTS